MATHPTKSAQHACDKLAEALVRVTDAARLDGRGSLNEQSLTEIAQRLGRVTSSFSHDEIVRRALARRVRELGLAENAVELLTLIESDVTPLAMLLLGDDELCGLIARVEEELGDL
jgi:hypothetical protein